MLWALGRLGGDADVVEALVSAAADQGMQMEVQAEVFRLLGLRVYGGEPRVSEGFDRFSTTKACWSFWACGRGWGCIGFET